MAARGQSPVFSWGDPDGGYPAESGAGTPVVASGNAPSSYTLLTRGWTPSAAGALQPGDWLQVGFRLYRNLTTANADTSGNATLNIWPNIRETISDGTPIALQNIGGLWRLSDNTRKWSVTKRAFTD